jgi:3-deoxy-D-manno-octulosonate 8-phosphate phosphatase (KDO 8-P phosphatase)
MSKFKYLVLDVDGVLTTGQFLYTRSGKYAKMFGPHDNDGIKLISEYLKVRAITADKRGLAITKKRVEKDMGIPLTLVKEEDRVNWFKSRFDLKHTIYIGDGLYDIRIFKIVGYSIAPKNAFYLAKENAGFVTRTNAGEGAVCEACLHILKKFFGVDWKSKFIRNEKIKKLH